MEPSDSPGSTMKTLDEIPPTWSQKLQCDETACPRFELVMDGYAVLDKETGLVWAKEANLFGRQTWGNAQDVCFDIGIGGRKGWRLPRVDELASLIDPQRTGFTKLPAGHPFANVMQTFYWSVSTKLDVPSLVYLIDFSNGDTMILDKIGQTYVWCVRGGR